ncbi:MAG: serpin family protein [Gemmatimonadetes bacterium]|nr:serpin family protein [Gemmatimonadota bacterium]
MALNTACDDPVGPNKPEPITALPRALTAVEQTVIARSNSFGFDLLGAVDGARGAEKPNTILSPLSASMALGMAMEGAEGETFTEMQTVLGFQGVDRGDITASYGGLLDLLLNLDPAVEVGIANSAWSRQGFPFTSGYFDALSQAFRAVVQELDFADPGAKDVINQWVKDQTNGRIDSIIAAIGPLDILFLINTVYFKGNWTTQFKKSNTQPASFFLDGGGTITVPMMSGDIEDVGFAHVDGGRTVAELPYGGQAFGLVVVLPGPGETVDDLLPTLDDGTWGTWMDALFPTKVMVRMPKFELEWESLLNDALKSMGMPNAFSASEADFSRMTPADDAHISAVKQKTYMRVDEEGTEAAAATSVTVGVTSAPPGINVDRSYLLAIRLRLSGTVLFMGVVRDPR